MNGAEDSEDATTSEDDKTPAAADVPLPLPLPHPLPLRLPSAPTITPFHVRAYTRYGISSSYFGPQARIPVKWNPTGFHTGTCAFALRYYFVVHANNWV